MYLWLAAYVDNYYTSLKEKAIRINDELGIEPKAFMLPYHISLKISFEVPSGEENNVINDIEAFYMGLKPFNVRPSCIENAKTILWIRYYENEYLKYISNELNKILNEKYGIPYHKFDLEFIFHSTIFMSEDTNKIKEAFNRLKDETLPDRLSVNRFIIGSSDTGLPYTFKVIKEIDLNN